MCAISLPLKSGISSLKPASVTVQFGLCQTWPETPKTDFLASRLICHPVNFGLPRISTKKIGTFTNVQNRKMRFSGPLVCETDKRASLV